MDRDRDLDSFGGSDADDERDADMIEVTNFPQVHQRSAAAELRGLPPSANHASGDIASDDVDYDSDEDEEEGESDEEDDYYEYDDEYDFEEEEDEEEDFARKIRALTTERALRAKQDAEYQESKAVDKVKQEERERIAREEREAAEAQKQAEQEERARQEKIKATLPSEPVATDKDTITIRLRFPTGDQQIRRFRMDESVKWLVAYCECLGYNMETYRLFTSDVPKKDVATLDNNKSFRELKWPPREQITIVLQQPSPKDAND